ncbi:Ribonuclease H [Abeliophyllum distichum]|uniref:Ribonuclease H n=1 Tax=Abeliophyllum distichum TaxID=126358 RepID=A0ABD1SY31_9LAMI
MFAGLIVNNMEVYVDDMLVKSVNAEDHIRYLKGMFDVSHEAQPPEMCLRSRIREVPRLYGQPAEDRGQSRKNLGAHQDEIPLIPQRSSELDGKVSGPEPVYIQGHIPMSAFLSNHQGRKNVRKPSRTSKSSSERLRYYPSQRLEKPYLSTWPYLKGQYPDMKKLALSLIIASRKLRPYFQLHSIEVLTNLLLRQILQKPDTSGRLMKWSVELSQFDISYKPRSSIKGQALADFMAEFTHILEGSLDARPEELPTWKLYVDGSSSEIGARAGILLISPDGHNLNCVLRLEFRASNNAVEYEAILAGLRLAQEMKARKLQIHSDSQLVVSQINGTFATREQSMVAYLKKAKDLLSHVEVYELLQIP